MRISEIEFHISKCSNTTKFSPVKYRGVVLVMSVKNRRMDE